MTEIKISKLKRATDSASFKEARADELRVLIALLESSGEATTYARIAEAAAVSEARARAATELWRAEGVIGDTVQSDGEKDNLRDEFESRFSPDMYEERSVDAARSVRDGELSELLDECAALMGKAALSTEEVKKITSIYTQLSLSPEFILTLAMHLAESGNLTAVRLAKKADVLVNKGVDNIEALGIKPPFQLSYDGVGQHDFLRGIDGCEERTLNALRLLQERGYSVSVSTCLHKGNIHTIRETVKLMASLGVRSMKIGATLVLGEWACDELREISLTPTEELEAFEKYIPEFFEDGAPLSIMLSGTFSYNKFEESWSFNCYRPCPTKWEGKVLSCPSIKNAFYVGADGMVAPCMGMCDCGYATNFPNLYKEPLRDILGDTHFMDLCATTVKQVRDGNDKCRKCDYVDKCTGGCRNSAIIDSDNFYDVDKNVCFFFENGWEDRLRAVSEEHYVKYCEKNGLTPKKYERPLDEEEIMC